MWWTLAAWVLLVCGVVGAVVIWRRARRFLTNLRIANENRNAAKASARSGAAARAHADVGGVHVHVGNRFGANDDDGHDDDDVYNALDVLVRAGFDVRHLASHPRGLDGRSDGGDVRVGRPDRYELLQAIGLSDDEP